jgi:hypothetical protein
MNVTLGITERTTFDEFLNLMHRRGLWREREISLSPEEYEIVKEKFVRAENHGVDERGGLCWYVVRFRPGPTE